MKFDDMDAEYGRQTRNQIKQLRERYAVTRIPTILLIDSTGKPYANIASGAKTPDDVNVEDFLLKLGEARAQKTRIHELHAEAEKAVGLEKAKALGKIFEYSQSIYVMDMHVFRSLAALDPEDSTGVTKGASHAFLEAIYYHQMGQAKKALKLLDAEIAKRRNEKTELMQGMLTMRAQCYFTMLEIPRGMQILESARDLLPESAPGKELAKQIEELKKRHPDAPKAEPEPVPAQDALWRESGEFTGYTSSRTATLLANGTVLTLGERTRPEIYDPETRVLTETSDCLEDHSGHTTTLLTNGKVFVTGGYKTAEGKQPLSEIYDPQSDTWSVAAAPAFSRVAHTATSLPNGQVLVVGGLGDADEIVGKAEVYDAVRNVWLKAGSLQDGRYSHTATLLPNGKVIVIGGATRGVVDGERAVIALNSVELYDPASQTRSVLGPLQFARYGHSATLLKNGKILVVGGYGLGGAVSGVEIYDPATNEWSKAAQMKSSRGGHTATLLPDGGVIVVGGENRQDTSLLAESYDPAKDEWETKGSDALRRAEGRTVILLGNGKLFLADGRDYKISVPFK